WRALGGIGRRVGDRVRRLALIGGRRDWTVQAEEHPAGDVHEHDLDGGAIGPSEKRILHVPTIPETDDRWAAAGFSPLARPSPASSPDSPPLSIAERRLTPD